MHLCNLARRIAESSITVASASGSFHPTPLAEFSGEWGECAACGRSMRLEWLGKDGCCAGMEKDLCHPTKSNLEGILEQDVQRLSTLQQLKQWLTSRGCNEFYEGMVVDLGITGPGDLPYLKEEDLTALNMPRIKVRRVLTEAKNISVY